MPTSFLADADGNLVALYVGPVAMDELLADLEHFDAPPDEFRRRAIPFAGRWSGATKKLSLLAVAEDFEKYGYAEDAEHHRRHSGPEIATLYYNQGLALAQEGRTEEAVARFREAVRIRPDYARAHHNLGAALASRGQPQEAVGHLRRAVSLDPENADAHYTLGVLLVSRGEFDESLQSFREAVRLNPEDPEGQANLGDVLAMQGSVGEAVQQYRRALRLRPDWPEVTSRLAWRLATCPDDSVRNGAEAVELAERLDRQTGHSEPQVLDVLAAAYAEAGRFDQAIATVEHAIARAEAKGQSKSVTSLRERLRRYEDGQTIRE
jgi:tetratricopeptide (TPR) repeat protein